MQGDLVACGVLSGNRNFEGRIHPLTRANYLASPPLVIAYAIAGTVIIDFEKEPLGKCAPTLSIAIIIRTSEQRLGRKNPPYPLPDFALSLEPIQHGAKTLDFYCSTSQDRQLCRLTN